MRTVGEQAPGFSVPGSDGEDINQYRLSDATESGGVVLLFYPFDYSPICTKELCEFRDSELLTFTDQLDVFGISQDSAFAHREMIRKNDLPFPLLSDHDGSVSHSYDVCYDEIEGHPQVSKRAVFVIDDSQTIQYGWETDDWTVDPDIGAVYDAVLDLDSIDAHTP